MAIVPRAIGTVPLPGLTCAQAAVVELFAAWNPANRSPILLKVLE